MATLERAIEIARAAHAGQVDKGGSPYIGHPLRVMDRCKTKDEKIVGILHDVVEDSDWSFEMLEQEGFSANIIQALKFITLLFDNEEDEQYEHYISIVMQNPLSMKVKLHDLEDNMDLSRLKEVTDKDIKRIEKYQQAYHRIKNAMEYIKVKDEV